MALHRSPRLRLAVAAACLAGVLPAGVRAGEAKKAAIFPAELDDPTLPYGRKPPPATIKRLELAGEQLRETLSASGGIAGIDLAAQSDEIRKQAPLFKCNGCADDIAKALGAELAVTILAEKGSSQVFNLTITISEAGSGKVLRRGRAVISANTDDDWRHAVRSIAKNQLLSEPLPDRS